MEKYKVVNGTSYNSETSEQVISCLESLRNNETRFRLYYGDTKTGRSWLDENDVTGTVGRSTGEHKIPLLINNSRSMGGGGILDNCIIGIKSTLKGGRWYYVHPKFHTDEMEIVDSDLPEYAKMVLVKGEIHARFKTVKQAHSYVCKMKGI